AALDGYAAAHLTGRDDHQTYVTTKSQKIGHTEGQTADEFAGMIRATLSACDVPIDYFTQPDRVGDYARFAKELFSRLLALGHIVPKTTDALFDAVTGEYLHEAHVRGKCPHCGSDSDGNACEECGRPNACVDLVDPIAKRTGAVPEV